MVGVDLSGILSKLSYWNNSNSVPLIPTYETTKLGEVKVLPFNLDFTDCTSNPLYWLDKLLISCGMVDVKIIALDKQSFKLFCSHPYIGESVQKVNLFLPEYLQHLKWVFGVTGRWVEVGGRVFVENDCKGTTITYGVDYEVITPKDIVGQINQQLESLLLHLEKK